MFVGQCCFLLLRFEFNRRGQPCLELTPQTFVAYPRFRAILVRHIIVTAYTTDRHMVLCHQLTGQLCGTFHGFLRDNVHAVSDNAAHLNANAVCVPAVVVVTAAAFSAAMPCRVAVLHALHNAVRVYKVVSRRFHYFTREIIRVILCGITIVRGKVQANPVDREISALAVIAAVALLKVHAYRLLRSLLLCLRCP